MPETTTLDTKLDRVLGAKTAKALANGLGLETAGDLIRHYPRRYDERGKLTDIASLVVDDHATVLARVDKVNTRQMRNRRGTITEVVITDGRKNLELAFFNQKWQASKLVAGMQGLFAGKVTAYRNKLQLTQPEYVLVGGPADTGESGDTTVEDFLAESMIPVYPAAAGIPTWSVARCVRQVLDLWDGVDDPVPADMRSRHGMIELTEALRTIHRPADQAAVDRAVARLKWDEALSVQLALAQRRQASLVRPAPACPARAGGVAEAFDARLPFELTEGQRVVGETVAADLAETVPMNRLLQGEVGSGKTIVALRAMLQVVDANRQAVLLAPTEVLAAQHARSLAGMLGDLAMAGELGGAEQATRITLLTGSLPAAARKQALLDAASGAAGIVVGTHALIQDKVSFADLGLAVVDEQHRFGVEQRDVLRGRSGGTSPHVLVMTATPIPRTVAMTVYGDLEVSSLHELPRGRAPIASTVVPAGEKPAWLDRAWQRVREEVEAGHQAYVVCPRIGDDGTGEGKAGKALPEESTEDPAGEPPPDDGADGDRRPPLAVADVAPMLVDGPLAGLRVGVLHGRLPAEEKDAVMRSFAAGETDVLVATTVVEVGVDVPNATVMVVLDAERFGVSQLHQLRGRVGRGSAKSVCLLVTESPAGAPSRDRLDAVASTVDGFELARIDLTLRREGDILGASQSGTRSGLRMLSLLRDEDLIAEARDEAAALVTRDPELAGYPGLAELVAGLMRDGRAEYLEKA